MADKTKTMFVLAGCAAAFIAFTNLSSGPSASADLVGSHDASSGTAASRDDQVVTTRSGRPSIVTYKSGEEKIEQSITDARRKLPYFWDHAAHPKPGENRFTLKVAFPVTQNGENGREHIWVMDVKRDGDTMTGRLDNKPDLMKGVRAGDTVSFTDDMITDWGFARKGKMIGFYSTRVMLEDAPPEEAAYIRSILGENPR